MRAEEIYLEMSTRGLFMVVLLLIANFDGYKQLKNEEPDEIVLNSSAGTREVCQQDNPENSMDTSDSLRRLRLRMKASSYDAYIIPSNDEHQSEYIAEYDKRREFISGFTGSSGTAVVLNLSAALWTDGRYFLQADQEMDCNWLLMKDGLKNVPTIINWLIEHLDEGAIVGADSKLVSYTQWLVWSKVLYRSGIHLVEDSSNLIDDIWGIPQGRIPESISQISIHDTKYSGNPWTNKIDELRSILRDEKVDGAILSDLQDICWLFNLRGTDVPYTPLFKAYAFVSLNQIRLYIKSVKLTEEIRKYLKSKDCNSSDCVQIKEYNMAFKDLTEVMKSPEKILISAQSSYALTNIVPMAQRKLVDGVYPISLMKTVKNSVEIQGMKNAHLKESVVLMELMSRIDKEIKKGVHWDELKVSAVLKLYRAKQSYYRGESFPTISASGPNGAIIHYRPKPSSNRSLSLEELFVLDTGAQYLDGTTDTTRTFHFGEPNDIEKEAYTKVLQGAINLMTAVFIEGVTDRDVDIIARGPLFKVGLNYLHGTGHGIGSYLSVHEGPVLIHAHSRGTILKPGMFMSDEPGFYEDNKFGIRLETVMMVVKARTPYRFKNSDYYTFEPVALIPFEPKLIKIELLTKEQIEWLNKYNAKIRNVVGLELKRQKKEKAFKYLLSKTEHIDTECSSFGNTHSISCSAQMFLFIYIIHLLFA